MNLIVAILLFVAGLILVIYFAEQLVKGVAGTSRGFGISTFLLSVIFIGFDPENLAVGAIGSYEEVYGIALGSIIGAAMVAIALAFGITALFVPMKFDHVPKHILIIPIIAVVLLGILSWDGLISGVDGIILLSGYVFSIFWLIRSSRKGFDIKITGEIEETLEKSNKSNKWRSTGIFVISLVAIITGSEMLVRGSKAII